MTTIVAVSSGRPPAAIAVIRISGRDAFAAARSLSGTLPPPRDARVRALRA
ncbi:MAG: tRNA uridine-5-carboxymethylaminomethyl(34) synthesis GTPase MnmE, partial [Pseudomonadota bacterium]|nr:tRNA uridine-5-carboxymethylaminomethyl(34) synthesis GTPase MnmE [Pseudomonadota bacterium]